MRLNLLCAVSFREKRYDRVGPEAAESLIETEDRVRDAYRRRFCPDMKDEFDGRHLCIDSSRLGLEESVKLCVEAARYLFYPGES